jgi:thioredoxin 1
MANSKNVLTADDTSFESAILKSSELSVVDFWAEWCGPCKALAPTMDEIADQYQGKAKVFKLNVDENPTTPTRYNVRGIPTVIFFKNGQVVDMLTGKYPKEAYLEILNKHLG